MAPKFALFEEIDAGRIDWKVRVRIIYLYKLPKFNNPMNINSIEVVLIDDKVSIVIL